MQDDGNEQWRQPSGKSGGAPYQAVSDNDMIGPDSSDIQEETDDGQLSTNEDDGAVLRWQAPEYIEHDRSKTWYVVFALVTVALMAISIFVFDALTFTILIPVMAVALFVYTRRPPQQISYTLSRKGLHVNDRLYPYADFKSFAVGANGGVNTVVMVPRKRFHIALTAYFPEEVGESLVDMLAARLPMQTYTPDFVDRLLTKLRI